MKVKISPSERENKRYLRIVGKKEDIEKAILEYIGILGYSKAMPSFIESSSEEAIISINRESINDVLAAFEASPYKLRILKISGTIRSLGR